MIHIFLTVSYISCWEHRVTLPFTPTNTDFWPVVLSASLQAFYTLYTAVLVFLTQRLAMSRALVRRLKLTSIHDISGAWAGLGSALNTVWKQTGAPASLWATTAVTSYLLCVSVLHVTSSTLLQFQTFNSSITTNVSTSLGWVDLSTSTSLIDNWKTIITSSLPTIIQFSGLVSTGLSNNTVYDTSQTNSIVGYAEVNATTITSSCAVLPNATYSQDSSRATAPFGNGGVFQVAVTPPWTDQIQQLQIDGNTINDLIDGCQTYTLPSVVLMISTLLEIEPSVQQEVTVPMTLELPILEGNLNVFTECNHDKPSVDLNTSIEVYFVQCSLSTNNTTVVIDMQTNTLQNPMPISQLSTEWEEMDQSTSTPWSKFMAQVLSTSGSSGYQFANGNEPSIMDEYIMSLVGLDLPAQYNQSLNADAPPPAFFVLSLDKLETAIAQTVAQLTWMGILPGEGMALVNEEVIALRLNITLIPLLFATSASVIMLGLALHTTRAFDASHDIEASIQNTGALQLLWLALEDVEHPTEDNLRRAGMIDVCFARTISDEEELPMRSSIDSVQGVDHGRDNGM
ncbi:hypothetical protein DEU56DRAFT_836709 [Suillus clintonianus]|uniref:uncharacterized protein n=1 Tax=Suillus clintonianus TaxID=1904413 RepID=UPI001B87040A|nr:uncharacterized protein DEU56DRAFT_836709 [Suillus clintonianus]KAG2119334.1 hypothetical protein DEU56DRAFT_836709 [Suillus clintonianus]